MKKLDNILEFIENNIDVEHVKFTEQLHLNTMHFNKVPYLPLTLIYPVEELDSYTYTEAFEDPEKMMYNELIKTVGGTSTYTSVMIKDHFPLQIRSNHGIGILASLFGAKCKIINNSLPWVEHLEMDELKSVISKGVPEFNQELGKKVFETHEYYLDKLKTYPKCAQCIRVTQPDLQGPFDIAHLLIGDDIFYGVYDYPEFLHQLLDVVTETYIEFVKWLQPIVTDKTGTDAIYLHGSLFGGNLLVKDDTASINLSEAMYHEFSKVYNERIFKALGGGSLHFCGGSRDWHLQSMDSPWLRSINYGNPELQDMQKISNYWNKRKIPNVLWGDSLRLLRADNDFITEVNDVGLKTGISLAIRVDSFEEAKRVLDKHITGQMY